ncbi:MAG: lipoyl domain-containing protein [Halanaeroarchaeum sp.]
MSDDRTPVTPDAVWPEDTEDPEALLVDWYVAEGAEVEEGESLCTIQVEKVDADVPAPAAGTVAEIAVQEDDVCTREDTLAWIES